MRKMGGLRKRIPVTFWTMSAGVFAIAGIWPFAGFFSKDEILYQTFISPNPLGKLLWLVGLFTAGLTAFYMFRLWFKTFFGAQRFEEHAEAHHGAAVHASKTSTLVLKDEHSGHDSHGHSHGVHESPWIMLFPLVVLAILSVIGGWFGIPTALGGHNEIEHFLDPVFSYPAVAELANSTAPVSHALELTLAGVSLATAAFGILVAWFLYIKNPGSSTALANRFKPLYTLVENKFYIDELYDALLVKPLLIGTNLVLAGFDFLIVGGIPQGTAAGVRGLGSLTRRMQSGNIRSYAGWLALGAAAVVAIMIFGSTLWINF